MQPEERDYARMEQEDLAALKRDFPELADFTSLEGLDDPRRYGELRDLGALTQGGVSCNEKAGKEQYPRPSDLCNS